MEHITLKEHVTFMNGLNIHLKNMKNISYTELERAQFTTVLFDYVVVHKNILNTYMCSNLKEIIYQKLLEFQHNNSNIFDAGKYLKILFNDRDLNPNSEIIDVLNNESIFKSITPLHIIFDDYIKIYPDIDDHTIIFDDYKINKFTNKCTYRNTTLIDGILENISNNYVLCNKNIILSMLNLNKTVEQIKNDTTYPNGPFLIKLSNTMFELYNKSTIITVSKGYIYSQDYSNVVIEKLGKYGSI